MAAIGSGLEILPLRQHTLVAFHLRTRDGVFEMIALEPADKVVEDKGVGSLGAVFRQNADEQQVDKRGLVSLEHLQQMPPAEG